MASTSTSTGSTRKTPRLFQLLLPESFVRAIQTEVDAGRISSHDGTLIYSTFNDAAATASAKFYVPFLWGGLTGGLVWSYLRPRRLVGRCAIAVGAVVGFCIPPYMLYRDTISKLAWLEDPDHALSHVANGLEREGRKGPPIEVEGRPPDSTANSRDAPPRSEDSPKRPNESPQDRARREWEEMLARERGGPKDN
ncbi:hypothetical protein EXIGLDRAFT_725293 [Exidia glandulosa HHB12029]|uniref:Uncharacterized protein n=1 Tax=Exidia glandulosa HHB12029 TaxID=1314781 RepID=A0A165MJ75_EXIGL|nr:hypothetical protein EXIGLDRAFT_725293 [Exidia glandulosa HHB12029]